MTAGSVARRNNVQLAGSTVGPWIVFAHGYGCDQSMWRFVAPLFEGDYRVATFDHAGFGGSDRSAWDPKRHASLDGYADDLLEILNELDARDVVFVGHSVSSMIGALAAIKDPDRFSRLVFVSPSPRYVDDPATGYVGGFTEPDVLDMIEALDDNIVSWSTALAPVMMGNADRPELNEELTASFCRVDPEVASSFVRTTFLGDNRRDLAHVTTPTLILQCRQDVIAPRPVGEYVRDHVVGSELVMLNATGHCPNMSAPEETVAAIKAWLPDVR